MKAGNSQTTGAQEKRTIKAANKRAPSAGNGRSAKARNKRAPSAPRHMNPGAVEKPAGSDGKRPGGLPPRLSHHALRERSHPSERPAAVTVRAC
jgi:hypothetical protein